MQRYSVYQFDSNNFIVVDQIERREICICGNYDEWEDAGERANKIASMLNENLSNFQQ